MDAELALAVEVHRPTRDQVDTDHSTESTDIARLIERSSLGWEEARLSDGKRLGDILWLGRPQW